MKNKLVSLLFLLWLLITLVACKPKEPTVQNNIVIGFSQSGTESSWRKAHTTSILDGLKKNKYQVIYRNGLMDQERQIQDIRSFIAYRVDMIVFTPLTKDGWEPVLKEAEQAGIDVILVDRDINSASSDLYLSHIGPSFKAEGNRAGIYVNNYFKDQPERKINVLELSGLTSASPTTLRSDGFREAIGREQNITVIQTVYGDYTRNKGKEVIRNLIKHNQLKEIDVLFSHNDEMTLGALDALKETAIQPGKDLIIVTIDGQENIIEELRAGRVNCVVECNPQAGYYVARAIERRLDGDNKQIPHEIYMPETVFSDQGDLDSIPTRNY